MDDTNETPGGIEPFLVEEVRAITHDGEAFIGITGLLRFLRLIEMSHQSKAEMAELTDTEDPREIYTAVLHRGAGIALEQLKELLEEAQGLAPTEPS